MPQNADAYQLAPKFKIMFCYQTTTPFANNPRRREVASTSSKHASSSTSSSFGCYQKQQQRFCSSSLRRISNSKFSLGKRRRFQSCAKNNIISSTTASMKEESEENMEEGGNLNVDAVVFESVVDTGGGGSGSGSGGGKSNTNSNTKNNWAEFRFFVGRTTNSTRPSNWKMKRNAKQSDRVALRWPRGKRRGAMAVNALTGATPWAFLTI